MAALLGLLGHVNECMRSTQDGAWHSGAWHVSAHHIRAVVTIRLDFVHCVVRVGMLDTKQSTTGCQGCESALPVGHVKMPSPSLTLNLLERVFLAQDVFLAAL